MSTSSWSVREGVSWIFYPALMGATVGGTVWGLQQGYEPALVIVVVGLLGAALTFALQNLMPYEERWRGDARDLGVDSLHIVSTTASTDLWRLLFFGLLFQVADTVSSMVGASLWPGWLPWAAQLAFALLITEFFQYWAHRWMHTTAFGWRLHAVHHSSERLHVFSSARTHPLNVMVVYGVQVAPLILLGASTEVLALVSAFTGVNGMVQHANADLRYGWLNQVFATADLHRWHHSNIMDESNHNFGSNLIVWDRIFGTWLLPEGRAHPEVGLDDLAIPENFFQHLATPFVLERFSTDEQPLDGLEVTAPGPTVR